MLGIPCILEYRVIWTGTIALSISNLPRQYAILIVPGDRRRTPSATPLFSPSVPYNRSSVIFSDATVKSSSLSSSSFSICKPLVLPTLKSDRNELLFNAPRKTGTTRTCQHLFNHLLEKIIFFSNFINLNLINFYSWTAD